MPFLFSFGLKNILSKTQTAEQPSQNMNLFRYGIFTFENYCPNNELWRDKHVCFCFILFLDFPPWLLPFEPLHTDYGYSSCCYSWGSWERRFCSDFVVWESAPLSISISLPLHLHFLWRWDRVLVGSPDWIQTHHVPSSFSQRLGTLAHAIVTIWFAHINASCRVFPVKAWGHVQA